LPFQNVTIAFQDEARFGRINSPHKCWVKGKRPTVFCQMTREYTYVYASCFPLDGTLDSLILPFVSTEAMNVFLAEVSKRHADKSILMFFDKASWHTAGKLNVPHNMRFVPLPSYSPELNPTEHVWDELREKFFHNISFDNMNAVENRLVEGLQNLENDKPTIRSSTSFNWIQTCV
jgi:transposase